MGTKLKVKLNWQAPLYWTVFSAIVFMGFQLVQFREHSFEASWIYAKDLFGIQSRSDRLILGSICNSLEKDKCAVRVFRKLSEELPGDSMVLSNLAMALVRLERNSEAVPYFSAYFSTGGRGRDVMLSYAKALRSLGQLEESIQWFYKVIRDNPSDTIVARELVSTLVKVNRQLEALSFLASLIDLNRNDETTELWFSELKKLEIGDRQPASDSVAYDLKFPSFDGNRFFLPFKTKRGDHQFILALADQTNGFQIDQEDLIQFAWEYKTISKNVVEVKKAKLGSYELENFNAELCEHCESKIGGNFLSRVGAYIDGRGKVSYLVLENRKNSKEEIEVETISVKGRE